MIKQLISLLFLCLACQFIGQTYTEDEFINVVKQNHPLLRIG